MGAGALREEGSLHPNYASNMYQVFRLSETVSSDGAFCCPLFIHQPHPKLSSDQKERAMQGFFQFKLRHYLCIQQKRMVSHGTFNLPSIFPLVFSFFNQKMFVSSYCFCESVVGVMGYYKPEFTSHLPKYSLVI